MPRVKKVSVTKERMNLSNPIYWFSDGSTIWVLWCSKFWQQRAVKKVFKFWLNFCPEWGIAGNSLSCYSLWCPHDEVTPRPSCDCHDTLNLNMDICTLLLHHLPSHQDYSPRTPGSHLSPDLPSWWRWGVKVSPYDLHKLSLHSPHFLCPTARKIHWVKEICTAEIWWYLQLEWFDVSCRSSQNLMLVYWLLVVANLAELNLGRRSVVLQ